VDSPLKQNCWVLPLKESKTALKKILGKDVPYADPSFFSTPEELGSSEAVGYFSIDSESLGVDCAAKVARLD